MTNSCEGICTNCPNPYLAHHAAEKVKTRANLTKTYEELGSYSLISRLFDRKQRVAALKKAINYEGHYLGRLDEWSPEEVIKAADHCRGPLKQISHSEDGRTWRTEICDAEAIAKHVTKLSDEEAEACAELFERCDDSEFGLNYMRVCGSDAIAKGVILYGYPIESKPGLDNDSAA